MGLSLLGATGSIGRQTLDVAEHLGLEVCALAAGKRVRELEDAARRFRPKLAVLYDEKAAAELRIKLADTETKVLSGMGGLLEAASFPEADTVLAAMSGAVGLRPALRALEAGKKLALANKETLVCAGNLVTALAKERGLPLLPVDSEHSAIFQCLQGGGEVRRILLTASGGPFRTLGREALKTVTREDALKHPNWAMGPKITVDSATLMNKGLEFIEAMWLFGLPPEKITVLSFCACVVIFPASRISTTRFPESRVLSAHRRTSSRISSTGMVARSRLTPSAMGSPACSTIRSGCSICLTS